MTWVRLDDEFPENPKIAALTPEAFRAHVLALCYCSRNLTDGYMPAQVAQMFAGSKRQVTELAKANLWEPDGNGGFNVHDYLEYNPTRRYVLEQREKRRRAGIEGARRRWREP